MNHSAPCPADLPETPVLLTVAGKENIVWRTLVRRAIPMLEKPERFSAFERRQLAQSLCAALEIDIAEMEAAEDAPEREEVSPEDEYEPGSELEFYEGAEPW